MQKSKFQKDFEKQQKVLEELYGKLFRKDATTDSEIYEQLYNFSS